MWWFRQMKPLCLSLLKTITKILNYHSWLRKEARQTLSVVYQNSWVAYLVLLFSMYKISNLGKPNVASLLM